MSTSLITAIVQGKFTERTNEDTCANLSDKNEMRELAPNEKSSRSQEQVLHRQRLDHVRLYRLDHNDHNDNIFCCPLHTFCALPHYNSFLRVKLRKRTTYIYRTYSLYAVSSLFSLHL